MKRLAVLALTSLLTLGLAACSSEQAAPTAAAGDPASTIERSARDLRAGDLLAVVRTALPPEQFEQVREEWRSRSTETPSEEERQQFAETMAKLTAPDAEAQLYAEFEPQLEQLEREMAAQMPLMVGMGRGFAMQSVQQSEQLTAEQKKQAGELVDAIANWLQGANFFDRGLARQGIAKVVSTARALDLQTLDQVHALEFEQAMEKAGIALRGLFDLLAIYGLKLDETLGGVKAETLTQIDDAARVKVDYAVFGKPLSFETDMVRIDGRWYGKDALAEFGKASAAADMQHGHHDHGHHESGDQHDHGDHDAEVGE
jgi:DNA primase